MSEERMTYRDAGVDIDAGNEAVSRMKEHIRSTFTPAVLTDVGSFGGMFSLAGISAYEEPVLVASTDGVGTKIQVARLADVHDSVGYDLVAHCVNDILVQGATPLFFLDYIALGTMDPVRVEGRTSAPSVMRSLLESPLTPPGHGSHELDGQTYSVTIAPGVFSSVRSSSAA